MMSVRDLFYGGREAVWIINTPNSGKKSSSNNPQTPQRFNQTPPPQTPQRFNQTPPPQTPQRFYQTPPQYNQQAMQYSPMQVIPYNVHTPQSASRGGVNADGLHHNSVVELNVPVCCEACEERVKYALLNISGVESVNCDSFSQSVVVTGNAAPAEVLRICRKLHKRSTLMQKKGPQSMMASPRWSM